MSTERPACPPNSPSFLLLVHFQLRLRGRRKKKPGPGWDVRLGCQASCPHSAASRLRLPTRHPGPAVTLAAGVCIEQGRKLKYLPSRLHGIALRVLLEEQVNTRTSSPAAPGVRAVFGSVERGREAWGWEGGGLNGGLALDPGHRVASPGWGVEPSGARRSSWHRQRGGFRGQERCPDCARNGTNYTLCQAGKVQFGS